MLTKVLIPTDSSFSLDGVQKEEKVRGAGLRKRPEHVDIGVRRRTGCFTRVVVSLVVGGVFVVCFSRFARVFCPWALRGSVVVW